MEEERRRGGGRRGEAGRSRRSRRRGEAQGVLVFVPSRFSLLRPCVFSPIAFAEFYWRRVAVAGASQNRVTRL